MSYELRIMNYELRVMSSEIKNESKIAKKAYAFAIDIVKLYKKLIDDKREFVLSKQLLRSGTSIGANINEAVSGQSKRDFVHKLSVALKEARETSYWLSLMRDSDFINQASFEDIDKKCIEIIKILSSIILTTKEKYFNSKSTHNS
jgi:four helix bundle protein